MKITNSSVTMSSTHNEFTYEHKESVTLETLASKDVPGVIFSLSAEGQSYLESVEEYEKQQKEQAKQQEKQNGRQAAQMMAKHMQEANKSGSAQFEVSDEYEMKLEMIRHLFEMLRQGHKISKQVIKKENAQLLGKSNSTCTKNNEPQEIKIDPDAFRNTNAATLRGNTTTWQRIKATSGFRAESECTTFASKGLVQTADGRSLGFNVEVSMSRSFMSKFDMLETEEYIKTDPLVINLDTNVASVTDQKFLFDLDEDGEEESISFAGEGSGFLALDKNGDGKINDGGELFGTKSGDGFKDLATYDEDGNGWIDENDSVFSKLRIWTKDANGNDYLMDLKKADVGAIYLGSANTQFSLKNDDHKLNAEIKKTGIYLHEKSGAVGTMNHVDLVV